MCNHACKKLPFVIQYIPDWYKNEQMCDKAILENGGTCSWLQQKSTKVW